MRRAVAAAGPALALAVTWGALQEPRRWGDLAALAALGVVPALVRQRVIRWVSAAVVLFAGLSIAFDVPPWSLLPGTAGTWFGEIRAQVETGFRAFEVIALPFDPGARPAMQALTLTAVVSFAVAGSLSVAARRPLLAALVVVVGGGWATASLPGERPLLSGALLLVAALLPLVVERVRRLPDVLALGGLVTALTVMAVGVAAAGAKPADARLGWQSWSLFGLSRERVGVRYVWDADYGGIDFPAKPTTVLRVRGPRRAHYWRASTLDLFTGDRWIENLFPILIGPPVRDLPADPLLPRAVEENDIVEQQIEVVALDDVHVVAASQPVRIRSDAIERVFFLTGGVMTAPPGVPRNQRYRVSSYVPTPGPRELIRSAARYPRAVARYLAIDRAIAPPFGIPGRSASMDALLSDARYRAIWAYRPVWDAARDLTRREASPYEATLAIERWFRTAGGFRYEEHPPRTAGPALVDFVTLHRAGYCQHFAGAMALMLRMTGIPARVAVGFTSGTWDGTEWRVSDTDAHAWVEAWFAGHGWLPFDPTPGRGSFAASYTLASDSAETALALGRGRLFDVPVENDAPGSRSGGSTSATIDAATASGSRWRLLGLAAALLLPFALVAAFKDLRRRSRYLSDDPRRLARAARAEIVEVLRDQGVPLAPGVQGVVLREALERAVGVAAVPFLDALVRARYGPPASARPAAAEMREALREVRRVMREDLGFARRMRGAASLRSLRPA